MTMTDDAPSQERDLAQARQAIAGSVPLIPEGTDTSFTLAVGLLMPSGEYAREAEVRELTGTDEEVLAKAKNELEFFSTAVALGVTTIGNDDLTGMPLPARKALLGKLLTGDRDRCFLEVARVTFGDEKEVTFTCPHCAEVQEATLVLSEDFPQKDPPEGHIHTFQTSKGDVIEYRLVTGNDTDEVAGTPGLSVAEGNTLMMGRCITKVNGELAMDTLQYAKNLSIRDRANLLQEMLDNQPSIDMDLKTECAACGGGVPLTVSWGAIFRT